jgi:hypothetical protein
MAIGCKCILILGMERKHGTFLAFIGHGGIVGYNIMYMGKEYSPWSADVLASVERQDGALKGIYNPDDRGEPCLYQAESGSRAEGFLLFNTIIDDTWGGFSAIQIVLDLGEFGKVCFLSVSPPLPLSA